jgi:small GTP-binding protein
MFSPRQQIKIIIVGDTLTGKTTLINNYFSNKFINNTNIEFYSKIININNIDIYFNTWDIKGDYTYNNITNSYLKEPNAFIILFDITNVHSFFNLSNWLERIYKYNKIINNYKYYPILLLGNKCDLELKRKISYDEAQKFALKNKLLYLEISINNIDKIITSINTYVYNVYDFIYNDNEILDKKNFIYNFNLEYTQNIVSNNNNNIKLSKSIEDMNNINNIYKNNHSCPLDCDYCISKRNNKKSCSLL